jgi:outer membrane lipoprotein LolB
MPQTLLKCITLCCLIILVCACSTFQTPKPAEQLVTWSALETQLTQLTNWQFFGKIGFRSREDAYTAAINKWQQQDSYFDIDLSSTFLGLGAVNISGTEKQITIHESGEEPVQSDHPDYVIEQMLNFPLPVSYLSSWLVGLPATSSPFKHTQDKLGRSAMIEQAGWSISYKKYQDIDGLPLPGLIKIAREDIRFSIAVKSWSLN